MKKLKDTNLFYTINLCLLVFGKQRLDRKRLYEYIKAKHIRLAIKRKLINKINRS